MFDAITTETTRNEMESGVANRAQRKLNADEPGAFIRLILQ